MTNAILYTVFPCFSILRQHAVFSLSQQLKIRSSQEIQYSFTPSVDICNTRVQSFEQLNYWFSRYLKTNCNSNQQQLFITGTFDDQHQNQTFKRGWNSRYIETETLLYIDNWRYLHQYLKWRRRYSCLVLFMFRGL